jgi:hypothetical protein
MTTETAGESLLELTQRLSRLESERDNRTAPGLDRGAYIQTLAEQQTRRRLERRERVRREDAARAEAEHKRRRRRERLEAELRRVREDRAARLEQHDRARARLLESFAQPLAEGEAALTALASEVEAQVSLVRHEPISLERP